MVKLVIFQVDKQQFALHLEDVETIIFCVETLPLPESQKHIIGLINFHGEFLPVIDIRNLFNLKNRPVKLTDQFIIANSEKLKLAIWVDAVHDVVEFAEDEITNAKKVMYHSDYVEGIGKLNGDVVLIQDIDRFLSTEQVEKLKGFILDQPI